MDLKTILIKRFRPHVAFEIIQIKSKVSLIINIGQKITKYPWDKWSVKIINIGGIYDVSVSECQITEPLTDQSVTKEMFFCSMVVN
jgi:hypothetical protein